MPAAVTIIGCLVAAVAFACWLDSHRRDAELAKIKRDIAALKAAQSLPPVKPPTVSDLYPVRDQPCTESNTA